MTNYVWYPVTGDGQTKATQFVWNTGTTNWNTSSDWAQGNTLVFENPALEPGTIPGSGGGSGFAQSQGPGADSVGLIAGDVYSGALPFYTPNPSKGDPFIGSTTYSVDVLINSGTVDIDNLLLSQFNQYAFLDVAQVPTLAVAGATLKVEGSIVSSATVMFPTITNVPLIGTAGGLLQASGGGVIDVASGGTVQVAGSVQPDVIINFQDANLDLLTLSAVTSALPDAFGGTIEGFVTGDTIALPGIPYSVDDTIGFNQNTLTISNGAAQLAVLPIEGSFTPSSFALIPGVTGTDLIQIAGSLAVSVDAALNVPIGATATISPANLLVTEPDETPSQLSYTVTSGPANGTLLKNGVAATTFTQADINNGLISYQETGSSATSDSFAFSVTDPSSNTVVGSFPITIGGVVVPPGLVNAYYEAILRVPAPANAVGTDTSELTAGTLTLAQLRAQLLATAQATSIPALLSYDFMYSAAPSSGGLTFLSTYAADLQSGNYTYTGGFQLGTTPGEFNLPQFSVLNTYVNLCATAAGAVNSFNATYGSLAATVSVANRTTFFNDVYQQIFGFAPAASTTALFVTNPAAANPSITTFQYYVNYAGSELGGYGAIAGVLLSTAETANLAPYPGAVSAFLTQGATSLAAGADTAPYGQNLLTAFPQSSGSSSVVASNSVAPTTVSGTSAVLVGNPASPTTVIAASGQTIDPGAGSHTIQFLAGVGNDTLVLHAGDSDQISGFDPRTDVLDLRSLLSGASINLQGDVSALSKYVTITDTGSNALVGFDPTGHGAGGTIATLQGLGNSVTSLSTLIAQGAVRMT